MRRSALLLARLRQFTSPTLRDAAVAALGRFMREKTLPIPIKPAKTLAQTRREP